MHIEVRWRNDETKTGHMIAAGVIQGSVSGPGGGWAIVQMPDGTFETPWLYEIVATAA